MCRGRKVEAEGEDEGPSAFVILQRNIVRSSPSDLVAYKSTLTT